MPRSTTSLRLGNRANEPRTRRLAPYVLPQCLSGCSPGKTSTLSRQATIVPKSKLYSHFRYLIL
jgi:hypothetical protein